VNKIIKRKNLNKHENIGLISREICPWPFFLPWQVMSHLAKERRVQLAAPPAPKYSEVARSETRSEGEARLGIFLAFFLEEKTL
jgi:hypothetical protein